MREWWANPRIPMSPVTRLRAAWVAVVVSLVGWPITALTVAAGEPQFVLGLSWLAITITALDVLSTADVRAEQQSTTTEADAVVAEVTIEEQRSE